MADNLLKSADSRRLFKKAHGDGEDPIIIAQRFLNIFRQLHIFSNERKQAFNRMILEQPPEIRGMFGTLPGGSLLQEYVDELEQKSGVSRELSSSSAAISPELSDEISKAKILATALAEAQIQANAQMQANAPQMQIFSPTPNTNGTAQTYSGPSKVVADASFAKEIAAAFSQALKFTEETRKSETKQLAAAIIASQEKMAKVFTENNHNTDLSSAILSTQEKMAQAISENTSAIRNAPAMTDQTVSTPAAERTNNKEIMDAIMESQNRMTQMIMQHNTVAASSNNNANNIQINAAPMPPVEEMVRGIVKAQSELFREMSEVQTKELSAIISVALRESQQLSTQTIVDAMERMQKENYKLLSIPRTEIVYTAGKGPLVSEDKNNFAKKDAVAERSFADVVAEKPTIRSIPEDDFFTETEDFQISAIDPDSDESGLKELFGNDDEQEASNPDENLPKKKKKKKKKKNKNHNEVSGEENVDSSLFNESVLTAAKFKDGIKDGLNTLASSIFKKHDAADTTEISEPDEEEGEWTWEEVPAEEEPAEVIESANAEPDEEEGEWTWEEVPAEEEPAEVIESANAEPDEEEDPLPDLADPIDSLDSLINSFSSQTTENFENLLNDTASSLQTIGLPSANSISNEDNQNADEGEDAGEEWEWEYEEEPITEPIVDSEPIAETEKTDAIVEVADVEGENADEEWEWEYEEEPITEPIVDSEPIAETEKTDAIVEVADVEGENADEEWEWEYEEEPITEPIVDSEPIAETEKTDAIIEVADVEGENADEEWEWEYEEEPQSAGSELSTQESEEQTAKTLPTELFETDNNDDPLNSLYDGDFIFEDNLSGNILSKELPGVIPLSNIDLGIAEIDDEKDKKEPYLSKNDIIG